VSSRCPLTRTPVRSSLYLHCLGGRRDLHSFPTRRSSDLSYAEFVRHHDHRLVRETHAFLERRTIAADKVRPLMHVEPDAVHERRSEEHTSELQSPYDLVCRLLLEKKKI